MREVEQKRKEQLLEDEERKALQFKDARQKQHEQLELQKSAFEVEMQMERQAFIFQKEKNAYIDRRKQNLDRASAQAAEDKGSELFRRELLLTQTGYDRSIHSAARRASDTINEKEGNRDQNDTRKSNDGAEEGNSSDKKDGSGRHGSGRDDSGNDDDDGDDDDDDGDDDNDDGRRREGRPKTSGVYFNPFAH